VTEQERSTRSSLSVLSGKDLALRCAHLLDEKRVRDLVIFEVGSVLQIVDYFIIGTGSSPRHVQRTADYVMEKLAECGLKPLGVEGYEQGRWVLFDYGDVVVHLMLEEARQYYNLELLWGDRPQVPWKPDPGQAER